MLKRTCLTNSPKKILLRLYSLQSRGSGDGQLQKYLLHTYIILIQYKSRKKADDPSIQVSAGLSSSTLQYEAVL